MIEVTTLTEGGQRAEAVARDVVAFADAAQRSLDIALYDVRLPGPVGDRVRGALEGAEERGVAVRLLYNLDVDRSGRPLPRPCSARGTAATSRRGSRAPSAGRASGWRIASPVITSGPSLGTLAEEVADGRLDAAGIVDAPQVDEVFHQWRLNGNAAWKVPLLQRVVAGRFAGKASTPWRAGSLHDYMHAKVAVADTNRTLFTSLVRQHERRYDLRPWSTPTPTPTRRRTSFRLRGSCAVRPLPGMWCPSGGRTVCFAGRAMSLEEKVEVAIAELWQTLNRRRPEREKIPVAGGINDALDLAVTCDLPFLIDFLEGRARRCPMCRARLVFVDGAWRCPTPACPHVQLDLARLTRTRSAPSSPVTREA